MAEVLKTSDSPDGLLPATVMASRGAKNTGIRAIVPSDTVVDAGPVQVAVMPCGVHKIRLKRGAVTVRRGELGSSADVSKRHSVSI